MLKFCYILILDSKGCWAKMNVSFCWLYMHYKFKCLYFVVLSDLQKLLEDFGTKLSKRLNKNQDIQLSYVITTIHTIVYTACVRIPIFNNSHTFVPL